MRPYVRPGYTKLTNFVKEVGYDAAREMLASGERQAFWLLHRSGDERIIRRKDWCSEKADWWLRNGRTIPHGRSPDATIIVELAEEQKPGHSERRVAPVATANPGDANGRKRGPKATILGRVKAEMREFDATALCEMTEEAMKAQFDASRDTCRRARQEVSAEQN